MVLGLGSKKKGTSVKLEFQIHLQEIRPWKGVETSGGKPAVVLQWQRGDKRTGKTKSVIPDDDGKIVFNESFRLPAKLVREAEGKGKSSGVAKFQKKTVVFVLQEASSERQLARCVVDLGEYGDLDSTIGASAPLATGKKVVTGGAPVLFFHIGPFGKKEEKTSFAARVSFGSRNSVSKAPPPAAARNSSVEPALDEDTRKSIVAALLDDDDDDEEEDDNVSVASFTDDEGDAQSSSTSSKPVVSETPPRDPTPTYNPSPTRSDASKSSPAPSGPSPARPDTVKASQIPSFPSPARSEALKNSQIPSLSSPARPATQKPSQIPTYPSPARPDPSKVSQSQPPRRDSGEANRNSSSSVGLGTGSSSATGLFTSDSTSQGYKPPRSSISSRESNNNPNKLPKSSPSSSKSSTSTQHEEEETARAELFSHESDSGSSKASKNLAAASEGLRGAPKLSPSGTENLAGKDGRIPASPSEGSRSPLLSSRGSPTPDPKAGTQSRKNSKSEVPMEKDRLQKSAIPLPPAASKAAAAASAYTTQRNYRSRGSSFDQSLESSSEDSPSLSPSPNSNGGRSPIQSPSFSGKSPSQSRTPRAIPAQGLISADGKERYQQNKEKKEEIRKIPVNDEKQEMKQFSTLPDEKPAMSKNPDIRKGEKGLAMGISQSKEEFLNDGDEEVPGSVLGSARANLAKVEKRALEELRNKVAVAEGKLADATQEAEEHARQLRQQIEKLEGELRDTGAMEVALYSVVAEHGNSSHKLHTPARRLVRLYMHASQDSSPERKARTARSCVSGLVTVAKSCGTDIPRLSFWWSNIVTLRALITQASDLGSSNASEAGVLDPIPSDANSNGTPTWARRSSTFKKSFSRQDSKRPSPRLASSDWREASTFIAALEKVEGWIYAKIIESLWWQAMIPRMQKVVDVSAPTSPRSLSMLSPSALLNSEFTSKAKEDWNKLAIEVSGMFSKKAEKSPVSLPELGDARQGNMSVEIWKKAMKDALCRLCPVRGAGHECGCLPMLIKMAIEGCVARLDVALLNAILRAEGDDVPTDPISDPVSDPSVLPISPGGLTFGAGSQLKNVVVTWSTWISGLVKVKEPVIVPETAGGDSTSEGSDDPDKAPKLFNLIKATGDLLMLPKDFLMDRSFRKEICPMLSLQLIRRILANFVPDEFAPDPITPSLLAALNAEAAIEKQRHGEADDISLVAMASAPPVEYVALPASSVWPWTGEASSNPISWGRSSSSLLRKGYTSDEDLDVMEQLQEGSASSKLDLLLGAARKSMSSSNGDHPEDNVMPQQSIGDDIGAVMRFQLVKEVWGPR